MIGFWWCVFYTLQVPVHCLEVCLSCHPHFSHNLWSRHAVCKRFNAHYRKWRGGCFSTWKVSVYYNIIISHYGVYCRQNTEWMDTFFLVEKDSNFSQTFCQNFHIFSKWVLSAVFTVQWENWHHQALTSWHWCFNSFFSSQLGLRFFDTVDPHRSPQDGSTDHS